VTPTVPLWEIEVFFKQIQQTLQLADFPGQRANASAWKVAPNRYLEPILRLCFPAVHAGTDCLV
jgi:hypothetical protein